MIVNVLFEILTKIKTTLADVTVKTDFQFTKAEYPVIVVKELSNTSYTPTKDSAGEHHSMVAYEIDIFTIGESKMQSAFDIRKRVDDIMAGTYGMNRVFADTVPNFGDQNICRYVMRYDAIIDINSVIYNGR